MAEDLDEILGNVVENAAKWAQARIRISVVATERVTRITIEDDGPGTGAFGLRGPGMVEGVGPSEPPHVDT